MMFDQQANLKYKFENCHLVSEIYCISTNRNEATVKNIFKIKKT